MGSLENGVENLILNGTEDRKEKEEEEEEEPILKEQTQRFCMFPIRYQQLWRCTRRPKPVFGPVLSLSFFLDPLLLFSFTCSMFLFSFISISLYLELGTCVLLCFLEYLFAIHGHGYLLWFEVD